MSIVNLDPTKAIGAAPILTRVIVVPKSGISYLLYNGKISIDGDAEFWKLVVSLSFAVKVGLHHSDKEDGKDLVMHAVRDA